MKRFEQGMVPAKEGEYVLYAEHVDVVEDLNSQIEYLKGKIDSLEDQVNYYMNN